MNRTDTNAEIGVFPALLEPAEQIAKELAPGEIRELGEYPSFFVSAQADKPADAVNVVSLKDGEHILFNRQ